MAGDDSSPGDRESGPGGLQVPTHNEQQVALVLLHKIIISDAARVQLERIAQGQPVRQEALGLMRRFEEAYVKERLSRRESEMN